MKIFHLFYFNDIDYNEYRDNYSTGVHLPPFKYTRIALLHHRKNCIVPRIELRMINMLKDNNHTVPKYNNGRQYTIVIHNLSPKVMLWLQNMVDILENNNRGV